MLRYFCLLGLALWLGLSACTPATGDRAMVTATEVVQTPAPPAPTATTLAASATVPPATAIPTEPAATAVPTEPAATMAPATLDNFIDNLKTALVNQEMDQVRALMGDPFAAGPWRSEWQTLSPPQALAAFQSGTLPPPGNVRFTDLDEAAITQLLGQPPATLFGPEVHIAAALHSSGWGQSAQDEVILFVAEFNGSYRWHAMLYTSGRFADAYLEITPPPAGLLYIVGDNSPDSGLFQIQADGSPRRLLDGDQVLRPNLHVSPDGHFAAYQDDQRHLWLINTTDGSVTQMAATYNLSYFLEWGNDTTLFVGVWLTPEEGEGPNLGHIATLNVSSGALRILDETRLSSHRPALAPDGRTIAFDVYPVSAIDTDVSHIYRPEAGQQQFYAGDFTPSGDVFQQPRFNPAWAPDGRRLAWLASNGERVGLQIFDLDARTVSQVFDWDPARFGGLIPSPHWGPDGEWLALQVLANGADGSGLWLIAADGSEIRLVDGLGYDPAWGDAGRLLFNTYDGPRLYDVSNGTIFRLDLPAGSRIIGPGGA